MIFLSHWFYFLEIFIKLYIYIFYVKMHIYFSIFLDPIIFMIFPLRFKRNIFSWIVSKVFLRLQFLGPKDYPEFEKWLKRSKNTEPGRWRGYMRTTRRRSKSSGTIITNRLSDFPKKKIFVCFKMKLNITSVLPSVRISFDIQDMQKWHVSSNEFV